MQWNKPRTLRIPPVRSILATSTRGGTSSEESPRDTSPVGSWHRSYLDAVSSRECKGNRSRDRNIPGGGEREHRHHPWHSHVKQMDQTNTMSYRYHLPNLMSFI